MIDNKGRKLPYLIRYAENPTQDMRTLFVLHGANFGATYAKFYNKDWNIVCPLDHYGLDKKGSWFLGEHDDFFIMDLIIQLVELVKNKTGSNRLYFWGSSMGGYAAILYGILLEAEAVYANVPFIKLRNCQMDESIFKKNFDYIFGNNPREEHKQYLDLVSLLSEKSKYRKMPTFFINNTRFHPYQQLQEQIFYFTDKCEELNINYYLEIVPKQGHVIIKSIAQTVALFDMYEEDILRKYRIKPYNKMLYENSFYFEKDSIVELLFSIQCDKGVSKNQLLYTVQLDTEQENYFKYKNMQYSPALQKYFHYIPVKSNSQNNYTVTLFCPSRTRVVLQIQTWNCTGKITITNVQEDKVKYLSQI